VPTLPTLTLPQARQLSLFTQGLALPKPTAAGPGDLSRVIRQIHALQMDTISVVARAHLHILYSRLGSFNPAWLEQLHQQGQLFEYFAHAVCLLPIEDYPLYRAVMLHKFQGWKNIRDWGEEHQPLVAEILELIRANGAVKSAEFKREGSRGAWWDWKVEKVALEYLYYRGDLMIAERQGFQRVYQLRERVLPNWDDSQAPSYQDALRRLVLKAVQTLGIAREDWAADYFYLPKPEVYPLLRALKDEGRLLEVKLEQPGQKPYYLHPDNAGLLVEALANRLSPNQTHILSPFDPLISHRGRTRLLFNFDYNIECYTPAPNRKFGYFALPILHDDQLVGRLDAKAWRKQRLLEVIKLYLEPGVFPSLELAASLATTLREYATWQKLDTVQIRWSDPPAFADMLNQRLS